MTGGYRNEGELTTEHRKLPEALQRRVGKKIRVMRVTNDLVSYINLLSGCGQTFRKLEGRGWIHVQTWTPK